jgi:hypothetical protein
MSQGIVFAPVVDIVVNTGPDFLNIDACRDCGLETPGVRVSSHVCLPLRPRLATPIPPTNGEMTPEKG